MGEFVMPALGADMRAGTLLSWHKQPGDHVARGDIIADVHTDKADIEVEVFTSGVIEKLLVQPGDEVPVGTPLALIREDGVPPATVPPPPPAPA
ncbi:MAG TPA: biotin/lipoyl-containing protein, partial [Gaiellaceae bacterium]|nr:biotin/lipoyl-containing protein [Gaiellaceae bacterium]